MIKEKKLYKRLFSVMLSIVMLCSVMLSTGITASAAFEDDILYEINSPDTATITGYYGNSSNIIIPQEIEGYTIIAIGDSAFSYSDSIVSVTIPDTVAYIGDSAFHSCTSLRNVKLGSGLEIIAEYAFWDCTLLKSIKIPDSVFTICESAFYGCSSLSLVEIGNSVEVIGDYAFYDCKSLKTVIMNDSVSDLGYNSFTYWDNYEDGNYYIDLHSVLYKGTKESWEYMEGDNEFSYDFLIDEVPEQTTAEGDWAYAEYDDYIGVVRYIGKSANVTVPSEIAGKPVTQIEGWTFAQCDEVNNVVIPDGVEYIGDGAFAYCDNMSSITIPSTVSYIGYYAFEECWHSKTVFNGTINQWASIVFETWWDEYDNYVSASPTYYSNSLVINGEEVTSLAFEDGLKLINTGAFAELSSVTDVSFPESLEEIGASVFQGTTVKEFNIPANVNYIGTKALDSWEVEAVNVDSDNSEYSSENGVLFDKLKESIIMYPKCKVNAEYSIPNTVVYIETSAFERCVKLKSINIPGSVDYIGDYAFYNTAITNVVISEGVKSIGDRAFDSAYDGCETITLPSTIEYLGRRPFYTKTVIYNGTELQWNNIEKYNSDDFNELTIKFKDDFVDKVVVLKSATNVTGGVKISWSAIPGAEKYVIYRKTSAKADWKKLYTTKTAASSYTDKAAKSGTKYYYTVKAARDGEYSQYDNDGVSRTYLAVPKISSVANKSSYVEIKWGKVTGASSYDVYRKVKGGSWKKLDSTKSTSFKDKTAKAGKVYEYKVRAKVGKSTTSEFSTAKKTVRLTTPKLTKVTPSKGKVTFTFGKVTGAEKYYIYRKTGSGSYKKIATTTSTKYVDKSVKKGTTYTYTVKAVKSSYSSAYNSTGLKVKAK